MNRIEWLDYMKGVAILIVVIGHVAHNIGGNYVFSTPIIICEMPLFFMLSGILANKTIKRTICENYRKKLQSLGIPLVVVGGIYNLCIGGIYWFLYDMYHMGFWFLLSLLSCWLIFIPLLIFLKRLLMSCPRFFPTLGELGLFLPFVIYKMVCKYISEDVDAALSLNFTFTYYRFFVVGYFIGVYYHKIKSNSLLMICVILTMSLLTMILYDSPILKYIPMTIQQLILSVCLSGTIYICYRHSCNFIRRVLTRYGRSSLVIYMFHIMVIKYINMNFLQGNSELYAFLGTFVTTILLCEVILLVAYPIEHNHYLRKLVLGKF